MGKSEVNVPAWVGSGVLQKSAVEVQHREDNILKGVGTFAKVLRDVFPTTNYPDILQERSSGDLCG